MIVREPPDDLRAPFETPAAWDHFERVIPSSLAVPGHRQDEIVGAIGGPVGIGVRDTEALDVAENGPDLRHHDIRELLGAIGRSRDRLHPVLETGQVQSRHGIRHRRYRQTFDGVPIEGGVFSVHEVNGLPVTLSGTPIWLDGVEGPADVVPGLGVPSEDVLRDWIGQAFGVVGHIHQARPMLLPIDRVLRPIIRVHITVAGQVVDVEAFFDSESGDLLLSYNVAAARDGTAVAFPVNPLRTPVLAKATLSDLSNTDDGRLRGRRVDARPGVPPPVMRMGGDFTMDPNEAGFDEVQAYFHVMGAIAFFEQHIPGLGSSAPFNPVIAVSHDPDSDNNSYWEPDTNTLRFGDFGIRPSARSADMVYHEVGHAVSDKICRLQRGPQHTQARGLSEGYSDYFACSAFDDPRFGDYVTSNPAGARRCDKADLRFAPDFSGREHVTGEVWANVLWDCRSEVGAGHMDAVAIESLAYLTNRSSFLDGQAALIAADKALHNADSPASAVNHKAAFMDAFARRWP